MMAEQIAPTLRTWTEAPASLTILVTLRGYDCQLTLRAETGAEVLGKLGQAIDWLSAHDGQPTPARANGNGSQQAEPASQPAAAPAPTLAGGIPDPGWCSIHNCAMQRRERNGEVWYSHKNGDVYCKGK
jgi:hypothetical protein